MKFYTEDTKLSVIEQNKIKLKNLILNNEVYVNNFKKHLKFLNLPLIDNYNVYSFNDAETDVSEEFLCRQILKMKKSKGAKWQELLSCADIVYAFLENNKIINGNKIEDFEYDYTFTGRSKCLKFNIQGASDNIYHTNIAFNNFICFDWIAADFRMAAILSNDKRLLNSFKTGDPYTNLRDELVKYTEDDSITRDDCKEQFLRCIYSIDLEHPILDLHPEFKLWMVSTIDKIKKNGYSSSMFGRKFYLSEDRDIKSVFNAIFQGSVAHVMHATLIQVFSKYKEYLVAEIHDSIVLSCEDYKIEEIINNVSKMMYRPFKDIDIVFPLKIKVGEEWKKWKTIKTVI